MPQCLCARKRDPAYADIPVARIVLSILHRLKQLAHRFVDKTEATDVSRFIYLEGIVVGAPCLVLVQVI